MTITSEQTRIVYATDGVATAFAVLFRFIASAHLRVSEQRNHSATVLTEGTDYHVTGANQPAGGTVITTVARAAGSEIAIERIVPITQETAYQRNDPFPERAHEQALDKLTMIGQQLAEALSRAIKFPASYAGTADELVSDLFQVQANATSSAAAAANAATQAAQSASDAASAASAADGPKSFAVRYQPGGFDLGTIAHATPFLSEDRPARFVLALGNSSLNFGALT